MESPQEKFSEKVNVVSAATEVDARIPIKCVLFLFFLGVMDGPLVLRLVTKSFVRRQ